MYSLPVWFWSLPFPPSKIHPGSCPSEHSRLLSPFVLFASSLSINAYSAAPLQCLVPPIVRPPSSVRRRATNPPAPADQCSLLVSQPSVPYAGLHLPPPDLYGWWYLAWVWVCVEGRRRRRPRGGLESVVSPAGITEQAAKCMPTPFHDWQ